MTACDLNVPTGGGGGDIDELKEVLSALDKSGYQKVALNHTVAKLNKAETNSFLEVVEKARKHFEKKDTETPGRIRTKDETRTLYTRLTLTLSGKGDDTGTIFSSNSPLLTPYDILSVAPNDFKTLLAACALDVDIIVVPHQVYFSYIRHAVLKSAMDRGVHFEISLGPYLRNPDLLKNFFAIGSALVAATGGKNILLTNGAEKEMEVRGIYDLANLATLLGLDFGIAKSALSIAPNSIFQRAAARKTAKGVLRVTDLTPAQTTTPGGEGSKKGKVETAASEVPKKQQNQQNDPQNQQSKRKGKRKAGTD